MTTYVVLVRGINVGGLNKVSMAGLKKCLEGLGFSNVSTFLNTGNVILDSDKPAKQVAEVIDNALPATFKLDSDLVRVLALSRSQFRAVVDGKPKGFGEEPGKYHSDAIFLMGITAAKAMPVNPTKAAACGIHPAPRRAMSGAKTATNAPNANSQARVNGEKYAHV